MELVWGLIVLAGAAVGAYRSRRRQAPAPPQEPDGRGDLAKDLAGGIAVTTALVGALGLGSGLLERAYRNEVGWSTAAVLALLSAVGLGYMARVWKATRGLLAVAIVLLLGGTAVLALVAMLQPSTKERPTVTAALAVGEQMAVEFTAKADGLAADETVVVSVEAVDEHADGDGRRPCHVPEGGGDCVVPIYQSHTGPNSDGEVEVSATVPVPAAGYDRVVVIAGTDEPQDCGDTGVRASETVGLGCLAVWLPHATPSPSLDVSVDGEGSGRSIQINVASSSLDWRSLVHTVVTGFGDDGQRGILYSSLSAATPGGQAEDVIALPLPASVTTVCVTATSGRVDDPPPELEGPSIVDGAPDCLPGNEPSASWAVVSLPSTP